MWCLMYFVCSYITHLNLCFLSCFAECSNGGNGHMGAAHSDTSQSKWSWPLFFSLFHSLLLSFFSILVHVSTVLKMFCECVFVCFPYFVFSPCSSARAALALWESQLRQQQDVQQWNNSQGTQMAGNETKKDKNQRPLPYYFVSFPSCWQHSHPFKTASGKEVHDCLTLCVLCGPFVTRVHACDKLCSWHQWVLLITSWGTIRHHQVNEIPLL